MTLTAKDINRGCYKNLTWSDDRRIKEGKISKTVAFELVFQPSGDQWTVFINEYDEATKSFKKHFDLIKSHKTRNGAELYIEKIKAQFKGGK
jgi:predicted RNA-binding protein associated with RNAse of E/G family